MESDWRWNPIFWFYNELDLRLAAKMLPPTPFDLPYYVLALNRWPFRAIGVPTTDGYVGFETQVFGVGKFPYGIPVVPDSP